MTEENVVSSSTASFTSTPHLRAAIQEEVSVSSFDSVDDFLNELTPTNPNAVHTTGAEYETILGIPLSERFKNMTEVQKSLVLNKIKETKRWKKKYHQNMQAREMYLKKIDEEMKKVDELQKEIQETKDYIKTTKEAYEKTQNGLKETEEELQNFKIELRRKLRIKEETDRLKKEKEEIERNIRIKSKITLMNQAKLLNKAKREKGIKKNFERNINAIKQFSAIMEANNILPQRRQEDLSNSIVDWSMQLALYEDSNMDEIYALHDGVTRNNLQKEDQHMVDQLMEDQQTEEESGDEQSSKKE